MTHASAHQIATATLLGMLTHLLPPIVHLMRQITTGTQPSSALLAGRQLSARASTKASRFLAPFTMASRAPHQQTVWWELTARNIQACTKT
jgi:hypothetical protein